MIVGCGGLVAGGALTAAAIATGTPWLLFVGTAVAGVGFGPAFSGAYRTVIASAPEPDRGALIAAAYTVSYAAFGIPALLAGIAVAPPPGPCTIPPCVPGDVADPVSEAVTA
jgi:MFS family permease